MEDDPDHQFLVREELEQAGHNVVVTASLHDSLDLLADAGLQFDAVVLDLDLPDHREGHGVEILLSVTKRPVIVHSSAPRDVAARALAAGAVAFVPKSGTARLATALAEVFDDAHRPRGPEAVPDNLVGTRDFRELTDDAVHMLRKVSGIESWVVGRVIDETGLVLAALDDTYDVSVGDVFPWSTALTKSMIEGTAPRVIADLRQRPSPQRPNPTDAPPILCQAAFPITVPDEGLFGAIVGFMPRPHPEPDALAASRPAMEFIARTLASALAADLDRTRLQRRLEVAGAAARCDVLTGLGNRRAWEIALRAEDEHCDRFGHAAGVIMIDLDGLKATNDAFGHADGDRRIRDVAIVLADHVRAFDQVFRIGGDEFAILVPEVGMLGLASVETRVRAAATTAGIDVSIGGALRRHGSTLAAAVAVADAAMYAEKRNR